LEYWSGKEKALVFGLIALAAVLAAALYVEASQAAQLRGEAAALNASLYAKTSQLNAALQRAEQDLASVRQIINQSVVLSATWIVNGDKCILRLHMPVSPGVYQKIFYTGNIQPPGGYYAYVELYVNNTYYSPGGLLHWYNLTDPELWYVCRNGTALAAYQERFVFPNGSLMEMGVNNNRWTHPNCNGICGPVIPLYGPIKPVYVDLMLNWVPSGYDLYNAHVNGTFAIRLPVQVEQVH